MFDNSLRDVSMTHCGWDNEEYMCDVPYSVIGEGGKLWLILREHANRKLITLINLAGDASSVWNAGRNAPESIENITLRVQAFSPVVRAWTASPDQNSGVAEPVTIVREQGARGDVLTIQMPPLKRFAILYLETEK